uniref:Uncharacterized protein n=1 Tax=Quercus lobata TaxID=97700 RepID=A0A7N2LZ94_QUELO
MEPALVSCCIMRAVYSAAALSVLHLNGGALLLLKGGAEYCRLCNGSAGRHLRTLTLLVDDGATCAGCDYKLLAVIATQIRYIKESEEIRLAMQPLELMKRVREIEQEVYAQPETVQQKDSKQTAAVDLSKRLKDFRSANDAASLKALEEWRKRKMDRARQRELGKNGTVTSQA